MEIRQGHPDESVGVLLIQRNGPLEALDTGAVLLTQQLDTSETGVTERRRRILVHDLPEGQQGLFQFTGIELLLASFHQAGSLSNGRQRGPYCGGETERQHGK
jgi:hypothetical protein